MAEVRSGSFNTSGYSDAGWPDHYTFSWSLVSQSIVDNTSTISWSLKGAGGANDARYTNVKEKYVTVNGATQSNSTVQVTYNGTTPFSGTTVIKHSSNGKGSFSASAGGAFYSFGSYNSKGSGKWDLPTIARATPPTLSATSITANGSNSLTITIEPADTSFKHKIRYEFGGLVSQTAGISISGNAITADFTAQGNLTATFTPPAALCNQIPNATSGTCKLILYTYNSSGTHIGTKEANITLNVPDYTPTISDIALTGNNLLSGAYVQDKSTVTASIMASTLYGASVTSYSSVVDGKTYTGNQFTSSVLSNGSKTVSVTVTDSRGKTATKNSSAFTVYAYANPTITSFTLERQSDGTTVIATVKGTVSAVNNKNAKTITVTLNDVTNTLTSSIYTIDGTTIFKNVPTDSTLTATAKITDNYISVTKDAVLPTVEVTMDFHSSGKGIAFGKVAETEDLFDVNWHQRIRKNLQVDGTINGVSIGIDNYMLCGSRDNITDENWIANEPSFIGTYSQNDQWYSTVSVRHRNGQGDGTNYGLQLRSILTKDDNLSWRQHVNGTWKNWRILLDSGIVADYVVEQGVSDDWNYTKWSNGKSEAWRKVELGDVPLTSSFAGGVYSNNSYNGRGVTLPSGLFTTIPLAFANVYSNGYTHCQVASATNTQIVYRLWSPYSATVTGVIVSLYVIGRWK